MASTAAPWPGALGALALCLALPARAGPLRIAAAGDLQLGTQTTPAVLEAVRALLPGDLRFVNLEGPITDLGKEAGLDGGTPRFCAPERVGGWLKGVVDLVSLANNHALDQGSAGLERTERVLSGAGIRFATNASEASFDLPGRHLTLLARDLSDGEPGDLLDAVRAARTRGPVLVSLHWGNAGSLLPSESQRALAHALVAAGASAVLGHGPHALEGVEVTSRAVIAYSLGNLAFTCRCTTEEDAYALFFTLAEDGAVSEVSATPLRAGLSRPPARGDAELAGLIADLSRDLGSAAAVERGAVRLSVSEPPTRGGQGAIKPRP